MRFVVLVCCGAIEVEFGGFLAVFRAEYHFLIAVDVVAILVLAKPSAPHIERFAIAQGVFLPIDYHDAVATCIDDAELAVAHEIISSQLGMCLEFQVFRDGHSASEDKAVVVGIGQIDFVRSHHFLHHEAAAQRLCVVVLHVFGMTSCLECHVLLAKGRHQVAHKH